MIHENYFDYVFRLNCEVVTKKELEDDQPLNQYLEGGSSEWFTKEEKYTIFFKKLLHSAGIKKEKKKDITPEERDKLYFYYEWYAFKGKKYFRNYKNDIENKLLEDLLYNGKKLKRDKQEFYCIVTDKAGKTSKDFKFMFDVDEKFNPNLPIFIFFLREDILKTFVKKLSKNDFIYEAILNRIKLSKELREKITRSFGYTLSFKMVQVKSIDNGLSDSQKNRLNNTYFKKDEDNISPEQDLMNLRNISYVRNRFLTSLGYKTISDISNCKINDIQNNAIGLGESVCKEVILSAKSFITQNNFQIKKFRYPDEPIFIDVETTPWECFLIGIYILKLDLFKQFFLENLNKNNVKIFENKVRNFLSKYDGTIVTYSKYDVPFIEKIIGKFKHYDLYYTIRSCFILPVSEHLEFSAIKYSLKNVEKIFGYKRKEKEISGILIPGMYMDYLKTKSLETKKKILTYNQEDVMSMVTIIKNIKKIKFKKAPTIN